jgi:hypothetical protein
MTAFILYLSCRDAEASNTPPSWFSSLLEKNSSPN